MLLNCGTGVTSRNMEHTKYINISTCVVSTLVCVVIVFVVVKSAARGC